MPTLNNVFTVGQVVVGHASVSDFNIDGITDSAISPEITHEAMHGAGRHVPSHTSIMAVSPMISLTVTDLATVLASIDSDSGLAIDSGGAAFNLLDVYLAKMANTGVRGGASVHVKATVNLALIVLRSLTLRQGQTATLSLEIHPIFDGTNAPIVFVSNVSLPHVASIDEKFTLGTFSANGTEIDGVQGVTINYNNTVTKLMASGSLYPLHAHVETSVATVEVQTKDSTVIEDFTLGGTAINATDMVFYAKKCAADGTFVADATAEHIKFTIDAGQIIPGGTSGSNNSSQDATVLIQPIYDGTNKVIVTNTASAIT